MRYLLVLFIVMPIAEMWVLITIGSFIGAINTIGLVLLTALIGIYLLKEQGFETLWRGREKLQRGHLPAQEMLEGLILAVSGALLLTPGFVTDTLGFMGLIPSFRQVFVRSIFNKISILHVHKSGSNSNRETQGNEEIIDGESWETKGNNKKLKDQ